MLICWKASLSPDTFTKRKKVVQPHIKGMIIKYICILYLFLPLSYYRCIKIHIGWLVFLISLFNGIPKWQCSCFLLWTLYWRWTKTVHLLGFQRTPLTLLWCPLIDNLETYTRPRKSHPPQRTPQTPGQRSAKVNFTVKRTINRNI